MEVLTQVRMENAKKKLMENDNLDQIASECGYRNRKYFCEAFRNYMGISVFEYRKSTVGDHQYGQK